jgi:outer membrane protein
MNKIFPSLILLFCSVTVSAVPLEEALISGYTHNEELKSIRNEFLKEIEQFPRALAGFMPRINANVNLTKSTTKNKNNIPHDKVEDKKYSKSISVVQPIFNGWSTVSSLRAAQSEFRASRSNFYNKEQEEFIKSIENYLNCVADKENYDISTASVKANKTQLAAARSKFKLGEATEPEVASAMEALATAEAHQSNAYAKYESSKANFHRMFGIEAVDAKMPDLPTGLPSSLDELIKIALERNPSIDSARHKILSSKAGEGNVKGRLLPNVDLRLEAGRDNHNPQYSTYGRINNDKFSSVLSVNIPILSEGGAEYSEVRRAKYQTRTSAIGLDNVIKLIKFNSKTSWSEFEAAKLRITASAQAVKAAEIAYAGVKQEEMVGSKNIIDVLNTEERLNKAKSSMVDAKKSMIMAAYKIKSLMGGLTAKAMNLKVDYFEPEAEFKKAKMKIIGF